MSRSLTTGWNSAVTTSGVTTSATPSATQTSPPSAATAARATDPMPNHWFAGLSRVHQCSATSASGAPNGRPMTAVAVWYTGSPPGSEAGNRTRSRCSFPIDPDTRVRNSTRSLPSHSTVSAVTDRSPSAYVATSREPAGRPLRPHGWPRRRTTRVPAP